MLRESRIVFLLIVSLTLAACGGQEQSTEPTSTELRPTETLVPTKIILDLSGDEVRSLAYSPDSGWLVTGSWGSETDPSVHDEIRIWNATDGEPLEAFSERGEAVLSVVTSPDGRWLAAGLVDYSDNVVLWDVSEERMAAVLEGHSSWVTSLAFSPDSQILASGSGDTIGDPSLKLWDVETLELIATLEGVDHEVTSLAFSPGGSFLASGYDDGDIQIWDLTTFKVVKVLNGDAGDVFSVVYSPDGSTLATGVQFATLQLWDVDSETILATQDHGAFSRSVAFSPDGMFIAAGLEDGNVIVLDGTSYELLATLKGHQRRVNSVAFSPVGDRLASGSDDSTVVLWPAQDFRAGVAALPSRPPTKTAAVEQGQTSTPIAAAATATPELPYDVRFDAFGIPMILVQGGVYEIGANPEQSLENCLKYRDDCLLEWFLDESPPHDVSVGDFMIDQFEVTNASYAECVDAGSCDPPDITSSATRATYYGDPKYDDFPVIYVSWEDVNDYCSWRGASLPTEAEWEIAARGGLDPYPWGSSEPVCAKDSPYGSKFDDEEGCNDTDTEAVGSYRPNDYGLHDMAGNVMEWTVDWYDAYPGGPDSEEYGEIYRVARGGSWYTFGYALRANIRFPVIPTASFDNYGLRCASAPFESYSAPAGSEDLGQAELINEWRSAISDAILLSTTCQSIFETHFNYNAGEIDIDRAKFELSAESDFVALAVSSLAKSPVPNDSVAPYILELEDQTQVIVGFLPPLSDSLIGSTQALDTLGSVCGRLNDLLTDIVNEGQTAGLSETSIDKIDQETVPLINDLYDLVLGD